MSNALTALNKEFWLSEAQIIFFKESAALKVAALELRDTLKKGDTLNHPDISHPQAVTYTKGGAITNKDRFSANQQLSVETAKVVPFYVDEIDRIQNDFVTQQRMARDGQRQLNNTLDQYVNYLGVTKATSYIDAGNVGGSAGSNISLSVSNIDEMATAFDTKLNSLDIPQGGRFMMMGPRSKAILNRYIGGKETSMGDLIGQNGRMPDRFGFELFYSNNNYYTATWTPIDNPTAGDTVTINGAVYEFVAAPDADEASTAYIGVDIGGSTAVTLDNLVAAINDSGTEGTTYGTTDANNWRARWKTVKAGVVATDGTTSISIVAYGDIVVAASETADLWSSQTSYILCGLRKSVSLVTQVSPDISIRPVDNKLGNNIFVWTLYGGEVFNDMRDALVYAKVDASSWT